MTSPTQQLFRGALLGDVIEQITGRDPRIKRSNVTKTRNQKGTHTCSHKTRICSGRYLIGVAEVVWTGKSKAYSKLVRERMRRFLKRNNIMPIVRSKNISKGILVRNFAFRSADGHLNIGERIFLKKLGLLKS